MTTLKERDQNENQPVLAFCKSRACSDWFEFGFGTIMEQHEVRFGNDTPSLAIGFDNPGFSDRTLCIVVRGHVAGLSTYRALQVCCLLLSAESTVFRTLLVGGSRKDSGSSSSNADNSRDNACATFSDQGSPEVAIEVGSEAEADALVEVGQMCVERLHDS